MCASVNGEEAYIYRERRWQRRGTRFLIPGCHTPNRKPNTTGKMAATLSFSPWFYIWFTCECFVVSLSTSAPGLRTIRHGSRHLHPCLPVQDVRRERWIRQHPEQRRIPQAADLSATQLCQGTVHPWRGSRIIVPADIYGLCILSTYRRKKTGLLCNVKVSEVVVQICDCG